MFQVKKWADDFTSPTVLKRVGPVRWELTVPLQVPLVAPTFLEAVLTAWRDLLRKPITYSSTFRAGLYISPTTCQLTLINPDETARQAASL